MADSGGGPLRITVFPRAREGQEGTGRGADPAAQGIDPSVQPPLPPPPKNPQLIAEIHVKGSIFRDWESVAVRHEFGQPMYTARFTCSEGMPLAKNHAVLRIKPGDPCTIVLAGILALTGFVVVRQVHYDAFRHQVEIQAASISYKSTQQTVQSKTHEFNKMNFSQVCRSILGPIGVPYSEIPPIPGIVIPRTSITPGQSCHEAIEQMARPIGVVITSNVRGEYVAAGGDIGGLDTVVEGKNIIEGREVIRSIGYTSGVSISGQKGGTDEEWGPKAAWVPHANQALNSSATVGGAARMLQEGVSWSQDILKGRAAFEGVNLDHDSVWVTVVVHGWLRPSGGLWQVLQDVHVISPMLIMDHVLILKAVTFTQDNATGSRSTLELVNKRALGGGVPQPPRSAVAQG
jgi:prophage tail gpP-like protein